MITGNEPSFCLYNLKGETRAMLLLSGLKETGIDNEPGIVLFNGQGLPAMILGISKDEPGIGLFDAQNKEVFVQGKMKF